MTRLNLMLTVAGMYAPYLVALLILLGIAV
jgi:hypothetical protein